MSNEIKKITEYLKSVYGILSLLPPGLTVVDSVIGQLPISTAIKPWAYLWIILLSSFGIWFEVSRTEVTLIDAAEKRRMQKRSSLHVSLCVLFSFSYWIFGEVLNAHDAPSSVLVRTLMLGILALMLAVACLELTRTFTILALTTMAPEQGQQTKFNSLGT